MLAPCHHDDGRPQLQPVAQDALECGVLRSVDAVEPGDVLIGALDQVGQGDEPFDDGARACRLAHELGPGVGVVAHGRGGPEIGQHLLHRGRSRGQDRGDRTGVDEQGRLGALGAGGVGGLPAQVEDIGGGAVRTDGGLGGRCARSALGARGQPYAVGLEMLADGLTARVGADPAVQLGVAAQPRQPESHVGRRPAWDVGGGFVGADDNVDEGFADD